MFSVALDLLDMVEFRITLIILLALGTMLLSSVNGKLNSPYPIRMFSSSVEQW